MEVVALALITLVIDIAIVTTRRCLELRQGSTAGVPCWMILGQHVAIRTRRSHHQTAWPRSTHR
jgi:hypothetical protein